MAFLVTDTFFPRLSSADRVSPTTPFPALLRLSFSSSRTSARLHRSHLPLTVSRTCPILLNDENILTPFVPFSLSSTLPYMLVSPVLAFVLLALALLSHIHELSPSPAIPRSCIPPFFVFLVLCLRYESFRTFFNASLIHRQERWRGGQGRGGGATGLFFDKRGGEREREKLS